MEGKLNNAKNGKRGSGSIPFGYIKVGDKLEIHQDESQWVKKTFRWRTNGISYSEIVRKLNKAGVITKRGRPFSIPSLQYVLENRFYFGESNFGNVTQRGVHVPIVGKRTFLKVQKILNEKKSKNMLTE
jgi:hypothetical protein